VPAIRKGRQQLRGPANRGEIPIPERAAGAAGGPVIVGLGVDIAEIDRIQAAIERRGAPILERLFTAKEIAYCESHKNKFERYAGRFAAKEAAMKALGTGWRAGVRWRDIEVTNLSSGKPTLRFEGATRQIADRLGVKQISLSITHSGNLALAQVIFEN
jgi:holo-[acyl-carrier protein] synthase